MTPSPRNEAELRLVLRPPGRGNWSPLLVRITGRHVPPPLLVLRDDVVTINGMAFRVVSVST